MKKITLMIFGLLLSISSFAQLANESFETWTTGSGPAGWSIVNVAGPANTWAQGTGGATQPAHTGSHSAYLNKENTATGQPLAEDWLITPLVTIPTSPQLHFWSRLVSNGDQGSTFRIMIGTSPTDLTTYTEVTNYTELTLNAVQQVYEEKIVSLPASTVGLQRYVAFVMINDDGDRWLVDDVSIVQQCNQPTNLTVSNPTATTASLNWTNPSGSTSWEIEVVESTASPTGVGVVYSGTLPYVVTGLNASTTYKYYVRSLCAPTGNNSPWSDPFTFSTTQIPADLNWSTDFETATSGFTILNGTQTNQWVVGSATSNSPTHSLYISNDNGVTNGYNTSATTSVMAYRDINFPAGVGDVNLGFSWKANGESCCDWLRVWWVPATFTPTPGTPITVANSGGVMLTGNTTNGFQLQSGWQTFNNIFSASAWAGTTRRLVFEWHNDSSVGTIPPAAIDDIAVTMITCSQPTALTATNAGQTSATLGWTNQGSATSWEVFVVPVGDPAPTAASVGVVTTSTTYTATGLTVATPYKFYVRAICDSTNKSLWSGPTNFNTTICEVVNQCIYTFNLTSAFGDGWETASMDVTQNGITVGTLTLDNGDSGTVSLPLCDGIPFTLFWTNAGFFSSEVGVSITNSFGQVLFDLEPFTTGTPNTALFTGTVDCLTPACLPPSGLTVTNVTETTASLGWAGVGTGNWEYYYVPTGSAAPTATTPGTATTTQPVAVTGLTASTSYDFYVRIVCGPGSFSTWAGPFTFSTTQIPATLNYNQDFETTFDWSFVNGSEPNKWVYGTATSSSPTHSVYISNDNGVSNNYTTNVASSVMFYRDVAIPAGANEANLAFDWKAFGESCCDFLRVWWVPSSFTPTAGTQITTGNSGGIQVAGPTANGFQLQTNWQNFSNTFNVSAFAGTTRRLIFEWHNDTSVGTIPPAAVDNVVITLITCPQPLTLTATNITANAATLGWTNQGTATSWELFVVPATDPAPTASSTGTVVTDNPHTVTGLTSGTLYKYYVRAICSPTDHSLWSGPFTFNTTICDPTAQCAYTFTLTDAFGDGWNGGIMSVRQNGITVGTLSLPTGAGPLVVTVPLCDGIPFDLFWTTAGSFPTEMGVVVQNNFAQTLFTHASGTNNANTVLYTGPVDCDTPACLPPGGLTVTNITTYTATVGWGGTTTGNWQVYYGPEGGPAPSDTETNVIATTANPVTITGLSQLTQYSFYVRVVCTTGFSVWAGPFNFTTLPICPSPTNLAVHCLDGTSGTFDWTPGGSETSWEVVVLPASSPAPASGTVVTTPMYYATDLTAGTLYTFYVRAVCSGTDGNSTWTTLNFTPDVVSPANPTALCSGLLAVPIPSPAGAGPDSGYGSVGCLGSSPNPAWYYITVGGSDEVVLNLTQTTPGGTLIDVDFAAFGPFTSVGDACYNVGTPPNTTFIVDCSYSASAIETINVTGTPGQVFALLITNYNGSAGNITVTQTSGTPLVCQTTVDLGPDRTLCATDTYNLTATVDPGGTAQQIYTYQWFEDANPITPPVVSTTATSQTVTVSTQGSHVYSVIVTMPNPTSPNPVTDQATIALSHAFTAPTPAALALCGANGTANTDLSAINFLGTLAPASYTVGVFTSQADANAGTNPVDITVPFAATTQTLYIAISDVNLPQCKQIVQLPITVNTAPSGSISYAGPYCTTTATAPVTVAPGTTAGGTYAATPAGLTIDPATGTITPSSSTAGSYSVTYTVAATATCPPFTTPAVTVVITVAPDATTAITYGAGPFCAGTTATIPVQLNGTQGGTYSSTTGLTIDPATGEINVAASTAGTYVVTYTIAATATCPGIAPQTSVTISPSQTATINYGVLPLCTADTNDKTVNQGGDAGGVYSSTPAGLTIDPATGTITPGTSVGDITYTVTYTLAATASCPAFHVDFPVTIEQAPTATISYAGSPFCSNGNVVGVTQVGTLGGTFAATPAGLAIDPVTGEINPATSTPGTYDITYTTPAGTVCAAVTSNTVTITITQIATPAVISYVNANGDNFYCSNSGTATVNNPVGATGGTYTAIPATGLTIDPATGEVTLATSTVGTYDVVYTIAGTAGCPDVPSNTAQIIITAPSQAGFTIATAACTNEGAITPVMNANAAMGVFTADVAGLDLNTATGVVNPATSTPGTYQITNTIPAANGCAAVTATQQIVISPAPVADFTYGAAAYCKGGSDIPAPILAADSGTFTATPTGLVIDAATGIIDLDNSAPGDYQVINDIAATATCGEVRSAAVDVTITSVPVIAVLQGCLNGVYTLSVSLTDDLIYTPGSVTIQWFKGNTAIAGATDESVVITEGGDYSVVVTPITGAVCPATGPVTVVDVICNIPKGISPGDATDNNDFNLTGFDVKHLSIFNRYGEEVYKFNGVYTSQWHGQTDDNDDLPTGTYFYMIRRTNGESRTGWVYINRLN